MSRAITGTKMLNGTTVIKQAEGGMKHIRCPKCQKIAIPSVDTRTGTPVLQCGGCGTQFTSTPM